MPAYYAFPTNYWPEQYWPEHYWPGTYRKPIAVSGVLTPDGVIAKTARKVLAGAPGSTGAVGTLKIAAISVYGKVIGYIIQIMQVLGYDLSTMKVSCGDGLIQDVTSQDKTIERSLGTDQGINQVIGRDE